MVKRFLLYGVDVLGNDFSIGMSIEDASSIFPDIADAKFSIRDQTIVAAQEARNLIAFHYFIEHRFFQHGISSWYLHYTISNPSTFHIQVVKYSILYHKIQELPYILHHGFYL